MELNRAAKIVRYHYAPLHSRNPTPEEVGKENRKEAEDKLESASDESEPESAEGESDTDEQITRGRI